MRRGAVVGPGRRGVAAWRRRPEFLVQLLHDAPQPDGSLCPQDDCPTLTPRQAGETVHGEDECFIRRDGSIFPIAWWSAPIAMPNGNGAVLVFIPPLDRATIRDSGAPRRRSE